MIIVEGSVMNNMIRFYQMETDFRSVNCGLCNVFILEDGSFIIEDGGHFTDGQAEALHDFLSAHSEGRIHVAAWLFSHAHADHIGAFIDYIRKFRDTEIKTLVYRFQQMDLSHVSADWKSNDEYAPLRELYVAVKECLPDVNIIHPVRGETYRFGSLSFEVLYTYLDAEEKITDFNDHSIVYRADCGETRILLLGDAAALASRELLKAPEKLACDIVQVAHHGSFGMAKEVYELTGARVALWPAARYEMAKNEKLSANRYLLFESDMKHILSNDGTAEFCLPNKKLDFTIMPRVFPDKCCSIP